MNAYTPELIYPHQSRVERIIASGRMILAAFFLLAIWIDPSQPSRRAGIMYAILAGYLFYSLSLFLVTWRSNFVQKPTRLITHIIDLMVFAAIMFLTEGPTSPFFVYFSFLLVCATLRWHWRGTLWTAVASLTTVITLAFYPTYLLHDPDFELHRFIIRIVYLAVMALLLGYLGAYDEKVHSGLAQVAAWPRFLPRNLPALLDEVLENAATILKAPRLILIWEEKEESCIHLASWSNKDTRYSRETPHAFNTLVAESLADSSFFCPDVTAFQPSVVATSPQAFRILNCIPICEEFRSRFAIESILAVALHGETLKGYLFALDKSLMSGDDLILGEIVAQKLVSHLDQFTLLDQLQKAAAMEERIRLYRDLHDGMLQSLTVAALQMEVAQQQLEGDPQAAKRRLMEIQRLIAAEQHDLRVEIQRLKPPPSISPDSGAHLADRLKELAERTRRHWGLHVEMQVPSLDSPALSGLSQQIYFMVHETLTNAARHAAATSVQVAVAFDKQQVHVIVADNGRGFPFQGRHDDVSLARMDLGPVTLRERIASLGGRLTIESARTGARLEITVPLHAEGN